MPAVLLIECPGYLGRPFFGTQGLEQHPEKRFWLPFHPVAQDSETDSSISRLQFPLVLGCGLSVEKSQGRMLESGVLHVADKASKLGILFTALSRFRHPDDLMANRPTKSSMCDT